MFFALLEDFYLGRLAVKDRDKTHRIDRRDPYHEESDKVVVPEVQAKVDEGDTPLRGMSIQLHKLTNGDAAVRRNQRCTLFQTQCTIKEKACKLIIDSGSYCNGISRAMVATFNLLTWRIPEPKHVLWFNRCGMLKITHKVRVPFTIDDYVDQVECVAIGGVWAVTWTSMAV
jgi:hypothetical protein